jgi:hypothetical protein
VTADSGTGSGVTGGLFEDDVGVGAAGAEGGHTGAARTAGLGPGGLFGQQPYGVRVPGDVRGRRVGVQGLRQGAVAHGHDHLDDAGDTGGGLGVAEVGLHRAEQQRPVTVLAVGGVQGLGLDGVAERGAGAVRLDGVDVAGGEAGGGQRLADDALLGRAVGGGQAVGRAVLVDGGAAQHGEDVVAVAAGVGEPLDDEHAHALGPCGAVGVVGEGLAAAVRRQGAHLAELDEADRGRHHGDTAREGEGALAVAHGLRREVQRDQ